MTDPERAGAEHAWMQARQAAPGVQRFAFYPRAGLTYTELSARAFRTQRAFEYAHHNDRGQLATLLDDTEFALYVTPLGERVRGEQWASIRRERGYRYSDARRDETVEERDALHRTNQPRWSRDNEHTRLPRPTRVVGTLLMFASPQEALALAVYDDPEQPRRGWFLAVEGARGDRAYYRLGELAHVYLDVATRDLARAGRR